MVRMKITIKYRVVADPKAKKQITIRNRRTIRRVLTVAEIRLPMAMSNRQLKLLFFSTMLINSNNNKD